MKKMKISTEKNRENLSFIINFVTLFDSFIVSLRFTELVLCIGNDILFVWCWFSNGLCEESFDMFFVLTWATG